MCEDFGSFAASLICVCVCACVRACVRACVCVRVHAYFVRACVRACVLSLARAMFLTLVESLGVAVFIGCQDVGRYQTVLFVVIFCSKV